MIDSDLAVLCEVPTKALNQAVKRNLARFPDNFMFRLTVSERDELVTKCDRLTNLNRSSVMPHVFTESGVAMLSSVLNSERAALINVQIVRHLFVCVKYSLTMKPSDLPSKDSNVELARMNEIFK